MSASCTICLDAPMVDPCVLPSCGHSFCAQCIQSIDVTTAKTALCPICRTPFTKGTTVPNWSLRQQQPHPLPAQPPQSPPLQQPPPSQPPPSQPPPSQPPLQPESADHSSVLQHRPPVSNEETAVPAVSSSSPAPLTPPDHPTPTAARGFDASSSSQMEAALNACRRIVGSASFQAQAGLFLKQHC